MGSSHQEGWYLGHGLSSKTSYGYRTTSKSLFFQILFTKKKIQHLQVLLVSMSSAENLWLVSAQYPDVSNEADVN